MRWRFWDEGFKVVGWDVAFFFSCGFVVKTVGHGKVQS